MAALMGDVGTRRRGRLDAALNLVPYIDLLTCMIAFLLITAVWSQLARLSVAQHGDGDEDANTVPDGPRIAVLIHDDGFTVVVKDQTTMIPKNQNALDFPALAAALKRVKAAHPDTGDARIFPDDGIVFETIIRAMDAAMAAGFSQLSLQDAVPHN